ncbi:hypothetical protein BC826DRAFT_16870 [Russula brevipes]|nr:hypothetical protein BC826DRAFT_16870 [Russula brevipes]
MARGRKRQGPARGQGLAVYRIVTREPNQFCDRTRLSTAPIASPNQPPHNEFPLGRRATIRVFADTRTSWAPPAFKIQLPPFLSNVSHAPRFSTSSPFYHLIRLTVGCSFCSYLSLQRSQSGRPPSHHHRRSPRMAPSAGRLLQSKKKNPRGNNP